MKLYPNQLVQQLQKNLAPIYLLSGDEPLLVQEAREQICLAAKKAGFTEKIQLEANAKFEWRGLSSAANSLSLFSDQTLIELNIVTGKPGRPGSDAIVEYCQKPAKDKILLILTPKLDSATSKSKWVTQCEKVGVFCPIWPIDADKYPQWIEARCRQAGLKIDSEGVKFLAENTEGNLLAAAQEIEKLKLVHGANKITPDLIKTTCSDNARFDVFQLIDQIHLGPPTKVLRILSRLIEEGGEAVIILWALTREIRTLANILTERTQGVALATSFKQHQIWPKRQPLITRALQQVNSSRLQELLILSQRADAQIKGMHPGNYWDTLMDISLGLSGQKIPGILQ